MLPRQPKFLPCDVPWPWGRGSSSGHPVPRLGGAAGPGSHHVFQHGKWVQMVPAPRIRGARPRGKVAPENYLSFWGRRARMMRWGGLCSSAQRGGRETPGALGRGAERRRKGEGARRPPRNGRSHVSERAEGPAKSPQQGGAHTRPPHAHTSTRTHMNTCICVHTHRHICTHVHTETCMYAHVRTCICKHTYVHAYIRAHMQMHTCMHAHK